jgi:hypothetical protein
MVRHTGAQIVPHVCLKRENTMRFNTLAALAIAGATTFAVQPATAQDAAPDMMMMMTVSMLGSHTQNALNRYGINADVSTLTVGQLGEIAGILANPMGSDAPVKERIEAAIRRQ